MEINLRQSRHFDKLANEIIDTHGRRRDDARSDEVDCSQKPSPIQTNFPSDGSFVNNFVESELSKELDHRSHYYDQVILSANLKKFGT